MRLATHAWNASVLIFMGETNMKLNKIFTIACSAAILASGTLPAASQEMGYREVLEMQLGIAQGFAEMEDMTIAAGPFFGSLNSGGSDTFVLPVHGAVYYRFHGVCDTDCSDLDIRIYNMSGALLAEDVMDDDMPITDLAPDVDGHVQVEVSMIQCSAEPCFYAVEAYQD